MTYVRQRRATQLHRSAIRRVQAFKLPDAHEPQVVGGEDLAVTAAFGRRADKEGVNGGRLVYAVPSFRFLVVVVRRIGVTLSVASLDSASAMTRSRSALACW